MMFCANCGKMLDDHDLFCPECGTRVASAAKSKPHRKSAAPAATESYQSYTQEPVPPITPKKKNPLRIILPIVGAIAAIGILAVVAVSAIGGATAKVGSAFANTTKEYSKVYEKLGMPKIEKTDEVEAFSQTFELELKDFPEMPELEGFGARMELGMNMDDKELGLAVTPIYASMDIIDAQILLMDDELYASVPQLTGGRAYMVNTETLGENLVNLGADPEAVSFGFNVFDLVETLQEFTEADKDIAKAMTEAAADLVKEIEVEKVGSDTLEINDNDLKCTMYDVVIPEDALLDYCDAIADAYNDVDTVQILTELLEQIGMPDYLIEEATMGMGDVDISEGLESIYMVIEELGDIELQVGLHKGLIAYVNCDITIADTALELSLELGGGKEYVDDMRLELEVENEGKIVVTSTGDHAGSDGTFTDETTVTLISDYEEISFTSETSYEPKAKSDNFQWTLAAMDEEISISGYVSFDKNSTLVDLDSIDVWSYGEHLIGLSVYVEVGKYESLDLDTDDAVEIFAMSEDEIYSELAYLEETVMAWAEELVLSNPELMSLLEGMMYY